MTSDSRLPQPVSPFHTTRWTRVCLAKADSADGRRALADLCDAYYEPVTVFLRCELRDADAASDMAHSFFAQMLEGGTFDAAARDHGRFRSYLLGAVKHFISSQNEFLRRLKRGGGMERVGLDEADAMLHPDALNLTPDEAFDRKWALTVLDRAMDGLRSECITEGNGILFEQLQPWLTGDASHGDQENLATTLGINVNTLKSHLHRMKRRFRALLKCEIAGTLSDGTSVEEEMQALYAALRGK